MVTLSLKELNSSLKQFCNPDEKENFLPHITIARFKKDRSVVGAAFKPAQGLPPIQDFVWQIKEVSLIQSILKSEGPTYEKLKCWDISCDSR